jgi:hypothetical protein
MASQDVRCDDCQTVFVLTEEEQAYYQETGYTLPNRCPACDEKHKAARAAEKAARRPPRRRRR